jgi:hypothetical protein
VIAATVVIRIVLIAVRPGALVAVVPIAGWMRTNCSTVARSPRHEQAIRVLTRPGDVRARCNKNLVFWQQRIYATHTAEWQTHRGCCVPKYRRVPDRSMKVVGSPDPKYGSDAW